MLDAQGLIDLDLAAVAARKPLRLQNDFLLQANVTLQSHIIWDGGCIHFDPGVKLILEGGLSAPDVQVFQYADRSCRAYVNTAEQRAAWWGLDLRIINGVPQKTDNNVPIQYALDAIGGSHFDPSYDLQWEGGRVVTPRGYCSMRAGVTLHGFTILAGEGRGTIFIPSVSDWDGTTNYLFKFYKQNAQGQGVSQFNSRLENCRISGLGFPGVHHQVLAWSPQEQSGWFNVHFDGVYLNGITYQCGYGGAAMIHIDQCEFWFADGRPGHVGPASLNGKLINIDMAGTFTQNWIVVTISNTTIAGSNPANSEQTGVFVTGRVVVDIVGAVHSEGLRYSMLLLGDACIAHGGVLTGGPDTAYLVFVENWSAAAFADIPVRQGSTPYVFFNWNTKASVTLDPRNGVLTKP